MTPDTVGPLSRPVDVMNLPPQGTEIRVEATTEECNALAKDFGLPGIRSLSGDFKLKSSVKGVHVTGTVRADVTQICVVTLDSFDSVIEEDVEESERPLQWLKQGFVSMSAVSATNVWAVGSNVLAHYSC